MWEWMHGAASGLLKNVETGKCLRQNRCVKGSPLGLDKCNAHDGYQQFQPAAKWIMAKVCPAMCLDVNVKSNDKKVVLWYCKNGFSKSGNQWMWLDFV
jgi:hypothetical protein